MTESVKNSIYQNLLKCTNAIPFELDISRGCFTHIDQQVTQVFGYPVTDWQRDNFWFDKIHPDDRSRIREFFAQSAIAEKDQAIEYRMLKSDGSVIWIKQHFTTMSEDRSLEASGFLFDITQHKQAENVINALAKSASVHNSDEFFRECVMNLANVYDAKFAFIGLLNADKKSVTTFTVWANGSCAENFTYELEGTPCKDILDLSRELVPKDAALEYPSDQMLLDMGIDSYYGAPLISSDNTVMGLVSVMDDKPMELNQFSSPILGLFASRIAAEIERKRASDALWKLNNTLELRVETRTSQLSSAYREMESFSYSVSHDLRAPLRSIDGFSSALMDDYADAIDKTGKNYLSRIRENAQRMGKLIDDLLNLSRIVRCELNMEEISLSQIASNVFSKHNELTKTGNISFKNNNKHAAYGDPNLINLLFENLISNALKYTSKQNNAVIEFDAIQENSKTIHYIRDNGIGFDMQYADKLFKPFQRLHDQREFEGTGVGLATVKRILHRHNGDIWFDAEPDKGATFYFTFGTESE